MTRSILFNVFKEIPNVEYIESNRLIVEYQLNNFSVTIQIKDHLVDCWFVIVFAYDSKEWTDLLHHILVNTIFNENDWRITKLDSGILFKRDYVTTNEDTLILNWINCLKKDGKKIFELIDTAFEEEKENLKYK